MYNCPVVEFSPAFCSYCQNIKQPISVESFSEIASLVLFANKQMRIQEEQFRFYLAYCVSFNRNVFRWKVKQPDWTIRLYFNGFI